VPGDQRRADHVGDLLGEQRLARPRLALDQQRPLEADRRMTAVFSSSLAT